MKQPKVALITFGDEREFEYEKLYAKHTEPRHAQAVDALRAWGFEVVTGEGIARTKPQIDAQVRALRAEAPDVLIAHVPCWVSPNMVCRGVERLGLPTVLVANDSPSTHATVGLLGAGGALDQVGYPHLRIRREWDCPDQTPFLTRLVPFVRAAAAKNAIAGATFGLFGGRNYNGPKVAKFLVG